MNSLLQFYRYTFYWGYDWSLQKYGRQDAPHIKGLAIVSFCLYLNLFAGGIFLGWLLNNYIMPTGLSKGVVAIFLLAFALPHYLYFVKGGRYLGIAAEFDAWDADRRWYMNRRVIFYIVGSFLALGLSMYLDSTFPNPLHLSK